jgi:hypothetical protein
MGSSDIEATIQHLTGEVRRTLGDVEHEPVGVLTAYKLSILTLADAIDRLADEVDSRTKPR